MKRSIVFLLLAFPLPAAAAGEFRLEDGDRVVFLGGTLIEREQRYGYWEAALTCRFPDKNVTFRNLGWSGDTVWGDSRAGFDTPAQGYRRLIEHTLALKPTVLFIGYGTNESFAGEEGLPRFEQQLNQLLDDLAPSKARVVLMAPPLIDRERWPQGDADQRDKALKLYGDAIKKVAEGRKAHFVGEFCQSYGPAHPLTENGVHLTAYGYWRTAHGLLNELKPAAGPKWETIELDGKRPVRLRQGFLAQSSVPPEPGVTDFQADSLSARGTSGPGSTP